MHSLCVWLSLTASYPDIGKFWCLLVYPVPLGFNIKKTYPTPKKPNPKPKNTTASKTNLLEVCLYTGFTRKVQIQFSWYFLYFFTPPSLFLSIRIYVSSNKYWGHLTLTKEKKLSYFIILKTRQRSKHCFYAVKRTKSQLAQSGSSCHDEKLSCGRGVGCPSSGKGHREGPR